MWANPGPLLYQFLYYDKSGTMFYPTSPVTTDSDGNEYILSVNCSVGSGRGTPFTSDKFDGEDWICRAAPERKPMTEPSCAKTNMAMLIF